LVYIRILGYLLHFIPSRTGLDCLAREIEECKSDDDLLQLGQMYCDQFLRPFKSNRGGRSSTSSSSSTSPISRPSFRTLDDMITEYLEDAPESHFTARKKVRSSCALVRDGFRCLVSGVYDHLMLKNNRELSTKFYAQTPQPERTITKCAHIFPEPMNRDGPLRMEEREHDYALWAIMNRFGYKNVITLRLELCIAFESMDIWFVATDKPNEYWVRTAFPELIPNYADTLVTFEASRPDLPVPSPLYLAVHAACAQVGWLSGATDMIERLEMKMEEGLVLSPSGDSAELLNHALRGLKVAGY
ncbi:hypothetical protein CPC08DRAFT_592999, partial [Agrocybe pediades]